MASKQDRDRGFDVPHQLLYDAYRRCIEARQNLIDVGAYGTYGTHEQVAQAELHAATLGYFEVLYPLVKHNQSVSNFWADVELWVEEWGTVTDDKGRIAGVGPKRVATGLKSLEDWYYRKNERETVVRGHMGERTVVKESPELLSVEVLMAVGRYLDEAMGQLGHLPKTEIPVADPDEAIV